MILHALSTMYIYMHGLSRIMYLYNPCKVCVIYVHVFMFCTYMLYFWYARIISHLLDFSVINSVSYHYILGATLQLWSIFHHKTCRRSQTFRLVHVKSSPFQFCLTGGADRWNHDGSFFAPKGAAHATRRDQAGSFKALSRGDLMISASQRDEAGQQSNGLKWEIIWSSLISF